MTFAVAIDERSLTDSPLGTIERRMLSPFELTEAIADTTLDIVDKAFASETSPDGNKWTQLAASTLESKRRRGRQDNPILVDSGEGRGLVRVRIKGKNGLEVAYLDYMFFHETGTRFMPARRFAPSEGQARDYSQAIARAYLDPTVRTYTVPTVGIRLVFRG